MDINDIIDNALKKHYRESYGRKRVPSDYLLEFTEGGESNAVASGVIKAVGGKLWEIQQTSSVADSLMCESIHALRRGDFPK